MAENPLTDLDGDNLADAFVVHDRVAQISNGNCQVNRRIVNQKAFIAERTLCTSSRTSSPSILTGLSPM